MSFNLMLKMACKDAAHASLKDRGMSLLGATLGVACVYAGWYTYHLARK